MSRPDVLVAERYRLVEQIAAGGMGTVWEAWDDRLQRRVALKQLHPQPGLSPAEAKLAGDRVMREARITARLHHPHAVPVYDVVDFDGQPCLIMQYLPSKSLQELIKDRGLLGPADVARIGSEIAGALAAAHQVGIVHRDVKPANVLIDEEGSAKITDFGISHAVDDVTLTSTGMVTGTPAFLAPEVARGVESSPASDVFSLGSTLYAAIEGSPPFGTEENPMAMLHRVASGQIIAPRRTGPLTDALMQMLAVDPAARPTMKAVAGRLAAVHASILDPASGNPTHRIDPTQRMAPPPPVAPPTTTVTLPAVEPERARMSRPPAPPVVVGPGDRPPERHHRGLTAWTVAAIVLVLALAAVLVTQLTGNDSGHGGSATGSHTNSPAHTSPSSRPPSKSSSARATEQRTSAAATTAQQSSSAGAGQGTSEGPTSTVQNYYSLLPDNTDAAWNMLTAKFQNGRAGGRQTYDNYWGQIRTVTASNVTATGSSTVDALITYTYKTGRVISEETSFTLVQQGGAWKIDSTG